MDNLYPVKCKREYKSIDPCPLDKTNLSLLNQLGLFGLCFRNSLHSIVAISAIPIGAPGCPEFALLTASRLKNLIAFASVLLFTASPFN